MKKRLYTRPVSVMLTDEMFQQIEAIAEEEDLSFSDYIRGAIQRTLEEEIAEQESSKVGGLTNEK